MVFYRSLKRVLQVRLDISSFYPPAISPGGSTTPRGGSRASTGSRIGVGVGAAGELLRSTTPSCRGREGSHVHGSGVSPKARRAASRIDPAVQHGPTLTVEDLSAAVYTLNAWMDSDQQWTDTIAAAIDDPANQLEAAAR